MKKAVNQVSRDALQLLHMQIKDALLEEYYSGNIPENTPCPSVRKLVRKFNTSIVTIDKVFKELKKDNAIYSVPGLGTFWGKKKNITRNNTVGICFNVAGAVSKLNSPYYFSMLEGIEEVFAKHDFNIKLLRPNNFDTVNKIREAHCDAFICTGTRDSILPTVDNFRKLNIPYLLLDRPNNDESLNYLERDSSRNIQELVDYLVTMGHRKICCVGQAPNLWIDKKLYIGFETGMKKHNLDFSSSMLQVSDYHYETLAKNKLSGMIKKHSALIILTPVKDAVNTVLKYCEDSNIKMPSDTSVVTLSAKEMKSVTCHLITPYEIGIEAAKGITGLLNNSIISPLHLEFPLKISEGNTVQKLKNYQEIAK